MLKSVLPPHNSWIKALGISRYETLIRPISEQLETIAKGQTIYPPTSFILNAFRQTTFEQTKVIIIGQDPYHGAGQAHGLSFSVPAGIPFPPSLRNILKELQSDIQVPMPVHGDLTKWANQGVLLMNAILTVEKDKPASHQSIGWQVFTDEIIQCLSTKKKNLVFILWGSYAQQKKNLISGDHLILEAPHPSPLSAHRGFFGSKPFSKTNVYLSKHQLKTIDWNLSSADLFQ